MRFLGVDYGLKNVGLALGVSGGATMPLKTLRTSDTGYLIKEIKKICEEEHIDKVIIGIPEFTDSTQKEITLSFAHSLEDALGNIPVVYVNEYGSSKEAFDEDFTKFSKIKKIKKKIHAKSAEKILENYWASFGDDTFAK